MYMKVYSQTWDNDHLRIATTCLLRPPFCGPNWNFYFMNDHWNTTTCQQWSLFLGPKCGRCTQVWLYLQPSKEIITIPSRFISCCVIWTLVQKREIQKKYIYPSEMYFLWRLMLRNVDCFLVKATSKFFCLFSRPFDISFINIHSCFFQYQSGYKSDRGLAGWLRLVTNTFPSNPQKD
jgi:hypothetical protein